MSEGKPVRPRAGGIPGPMKMNRVPLDVKLVQLETDAANALALIGRLQ